MLNPLSLQRNQTITGKEINDWCKDQIENNKSHIKEAKRLLKKNYNDNEVYKLTFSIPTGNGSHEKHEILFEKVNK